VDLRTNSVLRNRDTLALRSKEAQLFAYLLERANEVVTQEELLVDVWGYSPTSQTRTVYTTVRRLRHKIEPDPNHPVHLLTVHGEGYRLRLDEPGAGSTSADQVAALPCPPTTLIGRAAELEALAGAFERSRLVTLMGPGGMGKTRTALAFLEEHRAKGHVAMFCGLEHARTTAEIASTLLRYLGLAPAADVEQALARVGAALAGSQNLLLVLDNLEQAREAAALCVDRWLAAAPELQILSTSRVALRVYGEVRQTLGPLSVESGVELFRARASAVYQGWSLDEAELRELVVRLDGIPLAIELASARTDRASPSELLARLDTRLSWSEPMVGTPARHHSLQAAIEGSWALLRLEEQEAVRQAALFVGAFGGVDWEVVCPRIPGIDPLDLIRSLVEKSWLSIAPTFRGRGPTTWRMLDTMRDFVRMRFAETEDLQRALSRHKDYLLGPEVPEISRTLQLVDEHLALFNRLLPDDPEAAGEALIRTVHGLLVQGPFDRARALVEAHLPDLSRFSEPMRCRIWSCASNLYRTLLESEAATRAADRSVEIAERVGDPSLRAEAYRARGGIFFRFGKVETGLRWSQRAMDEASSSESKGELYGYLLNLGTMLAASGEFDQARALSLEGLELIPSNRPHSRAINRANLGILCHSQHRWEEAEEHLERAERLARFHGLRQSLGMILGNKALTLHDGGDLEGAEQVYAEALAVHRETGSRFMEAVHTGGLAVVLVEAGDYPEALRLLEEARVLLEDRAPITSLAIIFANMGLAHLLMGNARSALEVLTQAQHQMEELRGRYAVSASVLAFLGVALSCVGEGDRAQQAMDRAKEISETKAADVLPLVVASQLILDLAPSLPQDGPERARGREAVAGELEVLREQVAEVSWADLRLAVRLVEKELARASRETLYTSSL